ncbi:unnamed protein product [Lepeophtheirus salmonis]|uniref:(salmon louse) hypothetical protein n=1 Tax=Lepeophtheirus salmonis TaxID=72036 RepID=A0A7R8HDF6_LEPSM|nr:unnamed protein product [Lepeophtheirus salmonis]CAF3034260.1 unnamed protein product [Lepeophtheirus salmonis]
MLCHLWAAGGSVHFHPVDISAYYYPCEAAINISMAVFSTTPRGSDILFVDAVSFMGCWGFYSLSPSCHFWSLFFVDQETPLTILFESGDDVALLLEESMAKENSLAFSISPPWVQFMALKTGTP